MLSRKTQPRMLLHVTAQEAIHPPLEALLTTSSRSVQLDYRILKTTTMTQTLFLCRHHEQVALLLDSTLPLSEACWLLDQLLEEDGQPLCPVLLLTHHDTAEWTAQCLAHGAHDYLPWAELTQANLKRALRYASDRHHMQRQIAQQQTVLDEKERALREQSEAYRTLVWNYPDGSVALFDHDLRYLLVGGQGLASVQLTAEMIEGRTIYEVLDEETCAKLLPMYLNALQGQTTLFELKYRGAIGIVQVMPVYDADGTTVIAGMTISRELTHQRRIEEALRKSEALYRAMAARFPGGVLVIFDSELRYLAAGGSDFIEAGLSHEMIDSRTIKQLLPVESSTLLETHCRGVFAGKESNFELAHNSRTYQVNVQPVYADDGEIVAGMLTAHNITEGIRQAETLRHLDIQFEAWVEAQTQEGDERQEQQTLFEAVFDHSPISIYVKDLAGRYLLVNKHLAKQHNRAAREIIGKFDWELFPNEIVSVLRQHDLDVLITGKPITREQINPHAPETEIVLTSKFPIYDAQDTLTAIGGIGIDITPLKQAEAALRQMCTELEQRVDEHVARLQRTEADLAAALGVKGEFLMMMSHELRTPLHAILGINEALREEIYGPLNQQQQQNVQRALESGHHLLAIVNNMLDLARLDTAQIELAAAPIRINTLCDASLNAVRAAARQKGIQLSLGLNTAIECIHVDGRRFRQLLVHLLDNAIKFTPEGGAVGLEIESDLARQLVQFTVWDTGIGVASDEAPRLFQPFTQLDSRLARSYEGIGLGLTLVARLVELHGGGVVVKSSPGVGSRFTVQIPVDQAPPEVEPLQPSTLPPLTQQQTIVLVSGRETTAARQRDVLLRLGYRVDVVHDGNESLVQLTSEPPLMVLFALQLPGLDGEHTLRQLRANKQLADTPIVAISTLERPGDRERILAAGATDYLVEPLTARQLNHCIATYSDAFMAPFLKIPPDTLPNHMVE